MTSSRIDILCCPLPEIDAALLTRYEDLLSAEELTRWHSFRSTSSAKEFVVGRALLRTALAERINCDAHALQFQKNAEGKPSLSHPASTWQFNLTHSHDWVALALCEGANVGVDIESYRRRNNLPAIAARFFSAEENAQLGKCQQSEWLDYFFAVWTLKEAHAKALGCGLPKILPCSSIAVDLTAATIELKLNGIAATTETVSSWLYKLDEDCALALITHGENVSAPQIFNCVPLQSRKFLDLEIYAQGVNPPSPPFD
jgi:phosphopantetheine--protein transferase-like protein